MRFIVCTILLFFLNTAFSDVLIKGYISKDSKALPYYAFNERDPFPNKHYDISDIIISRTNEALSLKSGKEISESSYNMIDNKGSLDLVSYDKSTGYFKYRFTIRPKKLVHVSSDPHFFEEIPLQGEITFDSNHKTELFLEGKVYFVNNQVQIQNLNSNESGFSLEFSNYLPNDLNLVALGNINISIFPNS